MLLLIVKLHNDKNGFDLDFLLNIFSCYSELFPLLITYKKKQTKEFKQCNVNMSPITLFCQNAKLKVFLSLQI